MKILFLYILSLIALAGCGDPSCDPAGIWHLTVTARSGTCDGQVTTDELVVSQNSDGTYSLSANGTPAESFDVGVDGAGECILKARISYPFGALVTYLLYASPDGSITGNGSIDSASCHAETQVTGRKE